jgi:hypothetical protein
MTSVLDDPRLDPRVKAVLAAIPTTPNAIALSIADLARTA